MGLYDFGVDMLHINFNLIIYLFNEDYYQTIVTSSSPYYIYYFFNVVIVLTNLS